MHIPFKGWLIQGDCGSVQDEVSEYSGRNGYLRGTLRGLSSAATQPLLALCAAVFRVLKVHRIGKEILV